MQNIILLLEAAASFMTKRRQNGYHNSVRKKPFTEMI